GSLTNLSIPVAGDPLLLLIGPIAGLTIKVDGVAPAFLGLAFMEWVNLVIEVAPPDNPAIRVVDRHRPAGDANPMEKLLGFGLFQQASDLPTIRQPDMVRADPDPILDQAAGNVIHSLAVRGLRKIVGWLPRPSVAELHRRDVAVQKIGMRRVNKVFFHLQPV